MPNQPIVIIGFMAAGKTTVGRELASQLEVPFVDLDAQITEQHQRTPAQIIKEDGEREFRQIETAELRQVLNKKSVVIAAGGGAWTVPHNRTLITENGGVAIWLTTPFELCWKRIAESEIVRPMAPSKDAAKKLFDARRPIYQLADFHIDVSETDDVQKIARNITAVLGYKAHS